MMAQVSPSTPSFPFALPFPHPFPRRYMSLLCLLFFAFTGFVGFAATFVFLRKIYRFSRVD